MNRHTRNFLGSEIFPALRLQIELRNSIQTSVPRRTTEMEIILSLHAVIASAIPSKIIVCQSQLVQTTVPRCHCDCFSKLGAPRNQRRHVMILDGTAKTKDDTE